MLNKTQNMAHITQSQNYKYNNSRNKIKDSMKKIVPAKQIINEPDTAEKLLELVHLTWFGFIIFPK